MTDSEQRSNLYVWPTGPRSWMTMHPQSGLGSAGESRAEALEVFHRAWNDRSTVRVVDHAPPRARRDDDPKPTAAVIEGDTIAAAFHRALLKAFHSDRHGHRSYTGDEVVTTINRLWDEAAAK